MSFSVKVTLTCCVLGLCESGRLVINVLEIDPDLLQRRVTAGVKRPVSLRPLTPGRGPVPVAGRLDDDGVHWDFLAVQVFPHPQNSGHTQSKVALSVAPYR